MPPKKKGKSGGRRKPPSDRPYQKYKHIMFDPKTRIFTVGVLGHTRTADHDSTALHTRWLMFQEYAPARQCVVCGTSFKPEESLNERVCSDVCRTMRHSIRSRNRERGIVNVERYLSRREGAWIAEPYDAMHKARHKQTFPTEQEARQFITDIMSSTRRYRVRPCQVCGVEFDPYEQKLMMRSSRCSEHGGLPYHPLKNGLRLVPLRRVCKRCGNEFQQVSGGNVASYCDSCASMVSDPAPRACVRCGRAFRAAGRSSFCPACTAETTVGERRALVRDLHLVDQRDPVSSEGHEPASL